MFLDTPLPDSWPLAISREVRENPFSLDKNIGARKHCIHGQVEVDITAARERIREVTEQTGEGISFTGWVVYCCARAVDANKHTRAYRDWRNRLVLFDDVDVSLPVERAQAGQPVVLQTVIRAANRKAVAEIHLESGR